jgi:hypothetical protein
MPENDLDFLNGMLHPTRTLPLRQGHGACRKIFYCRQQSNAVPITALMAVESSSADAEVKTNLWNGRVNGSVCAGEREKGNLNTLLKKFLVRIMR